MGRKRNASQAPVGEPDDTAGQDEQAAAGDPVFESPDEVAELVGEPDPGSGGVLELEYAKSAQPDPDEDGAPPLFADVNEALLALEAVLFVSNEPLNARQLAALLSGLTQSCVERLVVRLRDTLVERGAGIHLVEVAGGYQFATRPEVAPWVIQMQRNKRRAALTPATLETVAIVAYRQPVTRAEVETIRGVESSAPLRTLQDLNLIEVGGRREVPGRPPTYVTTDQFLKVFGLASLDDLPSIAELKQAFAAKQPKKAEPRPATQEETDMFVEAGLDGTSPADQSLEDAQGGSAEADDRSELAGESGPQVNSETDEE